MNKDRQIAEAKKHAKILAEAGYTQPIKRKDVKVLGKQALGMFLVGTDSMEAGNYIAEHDKKIANKLAYVMAGGDLSEAYTGNRTIPSWILKGKHSCQLMWRTENFRKNPIHVNKRKTLRN